MTLGLGNHSEVLCEDVGSDSDAAELFLIWPFCSVVQCGVVLGVGC